MRLFAAVTSLLLLGQLACSESDGEVPEDGSGGSTAAGGSATTGGSNDGGGSTATGGSNIEDGGSGAQGGSNAVGGSDDGGGSGAQGGADAIGGSDDDGGSGAQGGAMATGGSNEGGSDAAGGSDGETPVATFTVESTRADDENPEAPGTVFIITWSVDLASIDSAVINFGETTDYGMSAPVDLDETDFRTLLLGMNPGTDYNFQITVTSDGVDYVSENFEVESGPATNLVTITGFDILDEAKREPGFILAAIGENAVVIGPDGKLVWWYHSTVGNVVSLDMSYDGKSMWVHASRGGEMGPLERVSMDTLEAQTYDNTAATHDLTPVSGETMAFVDNQGGGGCSDHIVEIDNSGATTTVLEMGDTVGSCHVNALRYNETEDLYTVSDLTSSVYAFNRAGELQWKLSDLVQNTSYGGIQHGHHLLENTLVMFANRATNSNSIIYEYSRTDGSIVYEYDGGEFSSIMGTVQRLPQGNTFVTYSNAGVFHEADAESNTVMTIKTDPIGFSKWRESLYGPPSDVTTW